MEQPGVPIIIANTCPFRLVQRDANDVWNATIDDINDLSYDYVKLHRLTRFLEIGLPKPFSMAIGFDGSFILPALPDFKEKENALALINKTIGEIVFGGIYYEAIQPQDLSYGRLYTNGYFSQFNTNSGLNSNFHHAIATKKVSPLDSIKLLNPTIIDFSKLSSALTNGRMVLNRFPNFSVPLALNGITYLVNNQWSESLSNIWTSIEQIISQIWEDEIIKKDEYTKEIRGRKEFLRDFRTWITSTKIELLYQKKLIDNHTSILLNSARKARNDFIHNGVSPTNRQTQNAIQALFALISLSNSNYIDSSLYSDNLRNILSFDSFERYQRNTGKPLGEVMFWMSLPPIPGDPNWGDKPFETFDDIQLQPIIPNQEV